MRKARLTPPVVNGSAVPALLTVREIASSLRVSPSAVYRAVERGDLRAVRIRQDRGAIRIPVAEFLRVLGDGLEERAT